MTAAVTTRDVTGEALVARARALAPILRARAAEAERRRELHPQTVDELREAGLLRVQKPARYGGHQQGYDVITDVLIELARGDASAAWVAMILNSAGIVAGFPPQAQDELWADGGDSLVCGVFSPGPVQSVDGGYRLSGRWPFASGIDHADWIFLGGLVFDDGPPDMRFFLVPVADITVDDDWFVSGLRATGSKTVVGDGVFVPSHRAMSMALLREGTTPGGDFHGDVLYRLPLAAVYHTSAVGVAIGIAQAAYESYRDWTLERKGRDLQPLSGKPAVQIRLAESAAEIDAATRVIRGSTAEAMARARAGEEFTLLDRARYHRDGAYACGLCVRAVDRLYEQSGASALRDGHPVQGAWRDVHAVAAHLSNRWDDAMEHFAHVELGYGPPNPFFY